MAEVDILELRTLGELLILVGGVPRRLAVDKQAALLVYLAFHQGHVLRRETLANLLWERSDPERARHSLSQAIYQLGRKLPELVIHRNRDEVWLEAGALRLDAERFGSAMESERFEEAVELYRGEFLAGFWVSGARTFEEWQSRQGAELGRLARHALHWLLREAESGGDWLRVMHLSSRLLRLDPYNEQVHRSRIQAIAASEGRQQALAELDRVIEFMEMELGRGLDAATRALKASLEQEPFPAEPRVEEVGSPHYTPFFGRQEEFGRLRGEWELVRSGTGRGVAIIGEPGIGKSRLCDHFLRLCAIQGARILQGRSHLTDQHLPYSAIVGMLLGSVRDSDIIELPREWSAILVELLPEFRPLVPGLERQAPLEGEGGRRRLFEAFVQLFLRMSADSPLVLCIDDFQWADESSAALVHYCTRRLAGSAVLILLSMRPEGEVSLLPVNATASADGSGLGYSKIVLEALPFGEVEQIIQSFAERQVVQLSESMRHVIYDQVGGRPFFVLEIVRAIAQGELSWESDQDRERYGSTSVMLPATVEEFLNRSMSGLGAEAAPVITTLAVLGNRADPQLLREVADIENDTLARGVEELVARGLVQETEAEVVFSHDLIREAAYRAISKTKRRLLHEAAGNVLRARGGGTNVALCTHYSYAGRKDLVYQHAMLAAEESSRVYGHRETEYFLRLALDNAQDPDRSNTAKEQLAALLFSLGRYVEAAEIYTELSHSEHIDRSSSRFLAIRSKRLTIELKQGLAQPESLVGEIIDLANRAEELENYKVAIEAWKAVVYIGNNVGSRDLVTDAIARISKAATNVQDTLYEVAALAYSANVLSLYQGITPAHPYAEEAVRRAETAEDRTATIIALCSRGLNRMQGGRLAEAELDFQRALALIERYAANSYQQFALNSYGVLLLEQGRYAEARRVLGEAIGLARDSSAVQDLVVVTGNLLLVEHESGDRAAAVRLAEEVLELSGRAPLLWCTIGAWSILGLYALEGGDLEAASTYRGEILAYAAGRDFWISDASYAEIFLARLSVHEGDRIGALARLDKAIAAYSDREFYCRTRLKLERAALSLPAEPEAAGRLAAEVRSISQHAGAWPLVEAADRILERTEAAAQLSDPGPSGG